VTREFTTFEFFAAPPTLWAKGEAEARRILDEAKRRWPYAEGLLNAVSSYESAASSLAPVAAAAYANIWAPTRPLEITHIEVWNTTTTALPQLQLIRSTARGTQTTTTTPTAASNATNPGFMLAPTFVIDTAWSVQPTLAALSMRMPDMAGTVGTSTFWDWGDQDPLQVVNGNGVAIQNASGGTTGVIRVQVRARE
jgi:hypothetical protein